MASKKTPLLCHQQLMSPYVESYSLCCHQWTLCTKSSIVAQYFMRFILKAKVHITDDQSRQSPQPFLKGFCIHPDFNKF